MAIATYVFLSWLAIYCFVLCKKRRTIVENTILYLIILIIHINWSWIIIEELAFLKFSHQPNKYLSLLINRSVLTPILILICFNLIKANTTIIKRTIYFLFTAAILTILVKISAWLDILTITNWHLIYDFLYFISLILICQLFLVLYPKFIVEKEYRTE